MATSTMCDFCGKRADVRGSGIVKIVPNVGNARQWDHCPSCFDLLIELLMNTSFAPEQPEMDLPESTGRTVSEIRGDIELFLAMRVQPLGRDRPEMVEKILHHLEDELARAQAGEEVSQDEMPLSTYIHSDTTCF